MASKLLGRRSLIVGAVLLLLPWLLIAASEDVREEEALMEFFKRHRPSRLKLRPKFPYPYDYIYAALLGSMLEPASKPPQRKPEDFSPDEGEPGTPEGALADIVVAWRDGRPELVGRHLDPRTPVACYLKGAYSHLLSPDEFLEFTRVAMSRLRTLSLKFRRPVEVGKDRFSAAGVHAFLDPGGKKRSVAVEFTFVRVAGNRWVVRAVNYGPAGEGRKHRKCPISTVAFGPGSEEVALLVDFRDRCLQRSAFGQLAVRAYYRLAPGAADRLEGASPLLRGLLRLALKPLVRAAEGALEAQKAPPPRGPALASM